MRKWRHAVGQAGIDLMDGRPHLLDLRFVDDILTFARSLQELRTIDRPIDDTFGAGRFAVECGMNCGANKRSATDLHF